MGRAKGTRSSRSSQGSGGSTAASKKRASRSPSSAKSNLSAGTSSRSTGRKSREPRTSGPSGAQTSLLLTFGPQDSRAKTSQSQEGTEKRESTAEGQPFFLSLLAWLGKVAPEFSSSKTFQAFSARTPEEISALFSPRWPNSGMLWDGVCLTAGTSESPNRARESTLSDVIETGGAHPRYFLSPNAARGMLRRADAMGRPLFPPLRRSLEILAEKGR